MPNVEGAEMTQLSKEQAGQALKHLATVFEQYTGSGNYHLTGPVELARVCRDFSRYICELADDAGMRPGDIPPQLKLLMDMLAISENFLDLAHVYAPFDKTMLVERGVFEDLCDEIWNIEKAMDEVRQLYAEGEDRERRILQRDLDSLKGRLFNLRREGF